MCTRMTSPVVIRQRRPNRVLKGFFIVVYSRQLNRLNLRIDRQEHERSWEIPTTCWDGDIRELLLCPAGWQYGSTTATSPTRFFGRPAATTRALPATAEPETGNLSPQSVRHVAMRQNRCRAEKSLAAF